jgi:UDP-N-acetylmuramate dehydrogenase
MVSILTDVALAPLTTLKVGGKAKYFCACQSVDDVQDAILFAKKNKLPIFVLGGGSNVLIPDTGYQGLVVNIKLFGIQATEVENAVRVTVGAGETLDDFVLYSVQNGWWGLENLSHVPGTIGATPVQNVGAYGREVGEMIESVTVIDIETQECIVLSHADCAFAYRDSLFKSQKGLGYIIVSVTFKLSKVPQPTIAYADLASVFSDVIPSQSAIRNAIISIRSKKFPDWNTVGTAGSFFKNPIVPKEQYEKIKTKYPQLPGYSFRDDTVKISLGWILDKVLSLRGFEHGNVGLYAEQALVLVTKEKATAKEIDLFSQMIIEKVKNEIGITVECEVRKIK